MLSSYPKVLALGHRYVEGVLSPSNIAEEKIDGSQISFRATCDGLEIRSRGKKIDLDNPDSLFREGVEYIKSVESRLPPGVTYRGEYLKKRKHNVLEYDRIPKNHIMIFDVEDFYGNPIENTGLKEGYAEAIGLEAVPLLGVGVTRREVIDYLLERESILGGPKIEGVVLKNYELLTPDGKYMVAKFVSPAFKEKHIKEWGEANPSGKSIVEKIIASLSTEARMHKAVQHLKEAGKLTREPKDIGELLKEIHKDIHEEETEYIKETLFRHFIREIERGVCKDLPEWYKRQLAEGAIA